MLRCPHENTWRELVIPLRTYLTYLTLIFLFAPDGRTTHPPSNELRPTLFVLPLPMTFLPSRTHGWIVLHDCLVCPSSWLLKGSTYFFKCGQSNSISFFWWQPHSSPFAYTAETPNLRSSLATTLQRCTRESAVRKAGVWQQSSLSVSTSRIHKRVQTSLSNWRSLSLSAAGWSLISVWVGISSRSC